MNDRRWRLIEVAADEQQPDDLHQGELLAIKRMIGEFRLIGEQDEHNRYFTAQCKVRRAINDVIIP